jgi:hypothetical protein
MFQILHTALSHGYQYATVGAKPNAIGRVLRPVGNPIQDAGEGSLSP